MEQQKLKKPAALAALLQPAQMAAIYLMGVLVWYPFCIKNYTQVSQTKLTAFLLFTLLCAVLLTFSPQEAKPVRRLWDVRSGLVAAYVGAALLSTVLSLDMGSSLWSYEGYLGGLVLCAACVIGYFLLCAFAQPQAVQAATQLFLPAGAVVCALALLNDFGIDPLGLYPTMAASQTNIFFSTIGNVDYLNSYFCLWLPVVCWQWLRGPSRAVRLLALGCAVPGLAACAALDPGILALGLAFAVLICLCVVPLDATDWQRLCLLAALYFAVQGVLHALDTLAPLHMRERPFAMLGLPGAAAAGLCAALAAAVLLRRAGAIAPQKALLWQRLAAVAVCAVAAALFVAANAFGVALGGLDNFFRISGDWATGRGAIWADATALFGQAAPLRKLIGYGPGMLHRALLGTTGLPYALTDTYGAHCEYLEELVCGGVVGLAVLLGLLAVHLVPALRRAAREPGCAGTGWALAACAYVGQAFFNNRVAAVFPLFMAVLAVLRITETETAESTPPAPRRTALQGGLACALLVAAALLAQLLFPVLF